MSFIVFLCCLIYCNKVMIKKIQSHVENIVQYQSVLSNLFLGPQGIIFLVSHRNLGNSTVTELQIRDFGLLLNHFVLYSYDLSQFEYFYKVQRYPCHHLKHKICQSSLLFRDQRGM